MRKHVIAAACAAAVASAGPAAAQSDEGVTVGLMLTLSGPAAVLGEQARNGFMLALEDMGGELGGIPTEVIVEDDELKPDLAANAARELVERDGADFVVGPIFSNIMLAIAKPVTDGGAFLVSPNAGTSTYAGAQCNENIFVTSYQNDQVHEVLGKYAQEEGYERVFLMAPNYQAGKDSLAGFKRSYDGEVVNEIYTPLGQLDFSAELAQIAAFQPDAVFVFMPGGMGVNLVKQYRQAGLADIPFLSAFTVDETTLPAQQDAALGFYGGANWAPDMDNEASQAFVEAYEAKHDAVPGTYAMQAYDAAQLIDSAIRHAGGDVSDKDAIREGLEAADFQSLRGDFAFNTNHYPIQDFYLVQVAEREDGKFETRIVETIFEDYADSYAAECPMQ
jgi:branched-chain amino acid transport system substrate-binding protein